MFPLGDWILLFICLLAWAEKHASRRICYSLLAAWLAGTVIEGKFGWQGTWYWHYAHLLVILVFWWWGWRRARSKVLPVLIAILGISSIELFILNKPGLVPFEEWLPTLAILSMSVFLSSSFWEMVVISTSSVLINQGLFIFFYGGLLRHADLPDPRMWNLGVLFFAGVVLYREVRVWFVKRGNSRQKLVENTKLVVEREVPDRPE